MESLSIQKNTGKADFIFLFNCRRTIGHHNNPVCKINCFLYIVCYKNNGVLVGGQKVVKPGPDRGVVYQRMALFPWLTVMGNVEYGPKVRGVPKKERRERAQHYIELVGLKGFENSYPNQLSGGMQQRVGIARAYCNEPDVLFMDEPFGHLDAQTRYLMQEDLMKIFPSWASL